MCSRAYSHRTACLQTRRSPDQHILRWPIARSRRVLRPTHVRRLGANPPAARLRQHSSAVRWIRSTTAPPNSSSICRARGAGPSAGSGSIPASGAVGSANQGLTGSGGACGIRPSRTCVSSVAGYRPTLPRRRSTRPGADRFPYAAARSRIIRADHCTHRPIASASHRFLDGDQRSHGCGSSDRSCPRRTK